MERIKRRAANKDGRALTNQEAQNRLRQSRVDKAASAGRDTRATGRRRPGVNGRGDYWTDAKAAVGRAGGAAHKWLQRNIPEGTFQSAGSGLGTAAGGAMGGGSVAATGGGLLGGRLGASLARLVGFGDYKVRHNSLIHPEAAQAVAGGSSFGGRGSTVLISHRECLGVYKVPYIESGGTPFRNDTFRIQPTNAHVFPWLAQIAENYVEYEIDGLIFSFETSCSPYSAQMGLGTIAMATQHNANAMPYATMDQVLNVENRASGNPAQDIAHGVECDPALRTQQHLFTRRNGTSGPRNLYDFGVLNIASEGLPHLASGTVLGRIYVTYRIRLEEAELPPATNGAGLVAAVRRADYNVSAVTEPVWGTGGALLLEKAPLLGTGIATPMLMSVGTGSDEMVRLLSPHVGAYILPELITGLSCHGGISNLNYWISDDSSQSRVTWLGFRYAGYFDVCFYCRADDEILSSHAAPAMSGHGGAMVYLLGESFSDPSAVTSSHGDVTWFRVYAPEPGCSCSIVSNNTSVMTQNLKSLTMLVRQATKWDTTTPGTSGLGGCDNTTAVHKLGSTDLQTELRTPITNPPAFLRQLTPPPHPPSKETPVESLGQKGKWVETRVFVPEDCLEQESNQSSCE